MSQVSEAGAGGMGAGTLSRGHERTVPARPDFVRRHPASLDPMPPVDTRVLDRPRAPSLVTAGLILLTAAAVLEGYQWLNVIPSSRLHPSALAFTILVVPCCLFLTQAPHGLKRRPAQTGVLVVAGGLVATTVVELAVKRPWSAHLLGAYDLAMAATILTAALIGGEFLAA
jgi:hypothetical protein